MNTRLKQPRAIQTIVPGAETQDGAGVKLTRMLPVPGIRLVDPFLLLDTFASDNPNDYIAGFPPHPHRGFETVTYLLSGQVRHRDSAGHSGTVKAGGVQWMTAGRGIEHSEMPEQVEGRLEGFQLWVNLPATKKMSEPRYQELEPEQIPEQVDENGIAIKVIAGRTSQGTEGPVTEIAADPLFLDIRLPAGAEYQELVPSGHNGFIFVIDGQVDIIDSEGTAHTIAEKHLAVLDKGNSIIARSTDKARFLLVAGRPIGEPISRHGPFVMNTPEEIEQAYADYRDGLFGHIEETHDAVA